MMSAQADSLAGPQEPTLTGGFAVRILRPGRAALSGIGTELSRRSISLLVREEIWEREVGAVIALRAVPTNVRLLVTARTRVNLRGAAWFKHECTFLDPGAQERERIVAAIRREPPDPQRAPDRPSAAKAGTGDFGLLGVEAQRNLVDQLVAMRRLRRPVPGQAPLLLVRRDGTTPALDGGTHQRFHVTSRITVDGCPRTYVSSALLWSNGTLELRDVATPQGERQDSVTIL